MHLCLAGAVPKRKLLDRLKAPSISMRFTSVERKSEEKQRELMSWMREQFPFIYVDSGAFSVFTGAIPHRQTVDVDVWFQKYLRFVLENLDNADVFCELDLDVIVGLDKVLDWRQEMLEAGVPREKLTPVFHGTLIQSVGSVGKVWSLWDQWCEEYPYVAAAAPGEGGSAIKVARMASPFTGGIQQQRRILEKARKRGAKVHSFGCTKPDLLKQVHYFSVDSTSWLAGSMYGTTYDLRRNGDLVMHQESNPHSRRRVRERILKTLSQQGIEVPEDVIESYLTDKGQGIDYVNGLMFIRWEEYLTKKAASRKADYWARDDALPVVYDEEATCTCDSFETRGACKRHGVGLSGVPAPGAVTPGVALETREKMSLAKRGSMTAITTGVKSSRVPQLRCKDCYVGDRCPLYEEDSVCGFDDDFNALAKELETRNYDALVSFLWRKLEMDAFRLQRSLFMEAMDGGMPWKQVEGQSARASADVNLLARLMGHITDGPKVDARSLTLIINSLSTKDHQSLLEKVAGIRDISPQLLEPPREKKKK